MTSYLLKIFGFLLAVVTSCRANEVSSISFDQTYRCLWGSFHLTRLNEGKEVQLLLDQSSGSGFRSKLEYGSGLFRIRMKIPDKNTTGIITSFYLTSASDNYQDPGGHDEIDFEFIGTEAVLQTNVFANDSGNREEKLQLWFDPRKGFHTYDILWNQNRIVFFVDKIPIRVFKDNRKLGVNYPSKPMHTQASIWNADWAGIVDWNQGPFISSYQYFGIDGCASSHNSNIPLECNSPRFYWNNQLVLNPFQQIQYEKVRKEYLRYNYCSHRPENHPECQIPPV